MLRGLNSDPRARLIWLAALSVISVLFIQQSYGQDGARKVIDIRIESRSIVSPKGAIRVIEQEVVEIRWTSDETVKLHLHGYDIKLDVHPGKISVMSIYAKATGRFPITSHGWAKQTHNHGHNALIYLEVYPR